MYVTKYIWSGVGEVTINIFTINIFTVIYILDIIFLQSIGDSSLYAGGASSVNGKRLSDFTVKTNAMQV